MCIARVCAGLITLGLPGLEKHIKAIYSILKRRDPILVESLEEAGLIPELYLTEWIISFGGYFIPIELTV